MREILFRGKRADKWVYGYFCGMDCELIFSKPKESSQIIDQDGFWHSVIPETVGQYTGLTDKNGTKIFEGDIVKVCQNLIGDKKFLGVGEVSFKDSSFIFKVKDGYCSLGDYCEEEIEVIGNIHDNPELIEREVEE